MPLTQTLQPNERGVALYQNGVFQGYENIVTLTAEELDAELEDILIREYLAQSAAVITMPQIWFLLRAFGKKLGYNPEA